MIVANHPVRTYTTLEKQAADNLIVGFERATGQIIRRRGKSPSLKRCFSGALENHHKMGLTTSKIVPTEAWYEADFLFGFEGGWIRVQAHFEVNSVTFGTRKKRELKVRYLLIKRREHECLSMDTMPATLKIRSDLKPNKSWIVRNRDSMEAVFDILLRVGIRIFGALSPQD